MNDAHLAVIDLVCHRGAAGSEHPAVEIAIIHAEHHATHILVIMLALPLAGISALLDEGLQDISPPLSLQKGESSPPYWGGAGGEDFLPCFLISHDTSIQAYALA